MFFIIDFDDISGGIGGFIKLFLIVGILAIPLGFMKWNDDNLVIGTIVLALCISAFISNVLTFISGLKGIKEKKIVKTSNLYRNFMIATICFIILSIIGYFVSLRIWKVTFKGLASVGLLSFLFSIVYTLLLQKDFSNKKMKLIDYKDFILDFLLYKFLCQQVVIALVIIFATSLVCNFGLEDSDFKNTGLNKLANNIVNYITTNIVYYNDKYEHARNGKSPKEVAQDEIRYIMNDLASNPEEKEKLASYKVGTNSSSYDKVEDFTKGYISEKRAMKPFVDKYGVTIRFICSFDDEEYMNLYVLKLYDYAYGKSLYYKFDMATGELGEQLENEDAVTKYKNEIDQAIRNKNN